MPIHALPLVMVALCLTTLATQGVIVRFLTTVEEKIILSWLLELLYVTVMGILVTVEPEI